MISSRSLQTHPAGESGAPPVTAAVRAAAAVESARVSLPTQGPIDVFIHHNTLHAFEDRPFEEAVESEARLRQAEPYLRHAEYLALREAGRIEAEDLEAVLGRSLTGLRGEVGGRPALELARLLLQIPAERHTRATLRWALTEGSLLQGYAKGTSPEVIATLETATLGYIQELLAARDFGRLVQLLAEPGTDAGRSPTRVDEIWSAERWSASPDDEVGGQSALRILWNALSARWKELPAAGGLSRRVEAGPPAKLDQVDVATIRLAAAYLDRGQARWMMPVDARGFLASALLLIERGERFLPDALRLIPRRHWVWDRIIGLEAADIVALLLERLGVAESDWETFLRQDLASIAGWAGMVSVLEGRSPPAEASPRPPTLIELVALRLILRLTLGDGEPSTDAVNPVEEDCDVQRQIFLLCQLAGWSGREVAGFGQETLVALRDVVLDLDDVARRRLWHGAYERTFQRRMLAAVTQPRAIGEGVSPARPSFQAVFCLDEREESIRRHLEETDPACVTFGAAGFFNVAVLYQDGRDGTSRPLCPVVVRPQHVVRAGLPGRPDGSSKARPISHHVPASHLLQSIHRSSRRLVAGQALTVGAGLFAALPMMFQVVLPRIGVALARHLTTSREQRKPPLLAVARDPSIPPRADGLCDGFTSAEMADRVEGLLRSIGLVRDFARLVLFIGHGSTTANNPFASAYECGACGGNRGDRNGRILAHMANQLPVRQILKERGLEIPADTVFLGGCHDTCSDEIDLFDTEPLPSDQATALAAVRKTLDRARANNAHERSRRFDDVPPCEPSQALKRVQVRAVSLREPRPEYGHGSNAWCLVGPRTTTRGLFLDRRCFLVSYEPEDDSRGDILTRTLAAIVPVCAGISLEYYFSRVDNRRFGAGTKLPHNASGLLGVMDGFLSDLRTGLPWQTVEIHEPMRLFIVVQTRPEMLRAVLGRLPEVEELVRRRWIHLAVLDREASTAAWYDGEHFTPCERRDEPLPRVPSSRTYYEGRAEHLWPVRITPQPAGQAEASRGREVWR